MNIRSADQGHHDAGGLEARSLPEKKRPELIVAKGSAAPDGDPFRHLFLNNLADVPDRNRIDGGNHLDCFYIRDTLQGFTDGKPERRNILAVHREKANLREAVRLFKEHAGDHKLFRGHLAVIEAAGRGGPDINRVRHELINDAAGGGNIRGIGSVREQMDERRRRGGKGLPFRHNGPE